MQFNEKLKLLRVRKGYTQEKVANYLNLSRSTYGGYETASQEPNLENLKKLAILFNVSSDYLLGLKETDKNQIIPDDIEYTIKLIADNDLILSLGGADISKFSADIRKEYAKDIYEQLDLLSYKYKRLY